MAKILIVYATTDGHTKKICNKLQNIIEQHDHKVTMAPIEEEAQFDLSKFDTIVIGASIRYGKHSPRVIEYIKKNRSLLENKQTAFFSVDLVSRKPEKRQPDNNPYLQRTLRQVSWKPKVLAVFPGKIDYPSCGFMDRQIIRLIMWITNGPTDSKAIIEFTDWDEVDSFGHTVSTM